MTTLTESADPLVEQLLAATGRDGAGNGNGLAAEISRAQARRVATKVGRGMLAATDIDTARHSDDVVVISRAMCDLLEIRGERRQDLLTAARLHDIGKAAVPAEILEKPGPLSDREWELMRAHTAVGAEILSSVSELAGVAVLVRHSHERWDGAGYPVGLSGELIPLGSRIIFCADAFHAIRSHRPYRPGRPAADALAELRANAGTQFDPAMVDALGEVVRDLKLVDGPRRVRRTNRLMALLLCLAVGGTGSAIARSGLLGDPSAAGESQAPITRTDCASLGCSSLLSVSLAEQFRQGKAADRAQGRTRANRPTDSTPGAPVGPSESNRPAGDSPAGAPAPSGQDGAADSAPPGDSGPSGGGGPGQPSGGGGGNSNGPTKQGGGPGSAPGNSGSNPHGGPPGLAGGGPPGQSGGGNGGGGPPGQAKK